MKLSFLDFQGNFGDRVAVIDTLLIHSCYHPGLQSAKVKDCFDIIAECGCSVHYIIDEDGQVYCTLPDEYKAYHAGRGMLPFMLDARDRINEFSIGIEVLGFYDDPNYEFTHAALLSLRSLIKRLREKFPIQYVLGHHQTSPSRKRDPGRIIW